MRNLCELILELSGKNLISQMAPFSNVGNSDNVNFAVLVYSHQLPDHHVLSTESSPLECAEELYDI